MTPSIKLKTCVYQLHQSKSEIPIKQTLCLKQNLTLLTTICLDPLVLIEVSTEIFVFSSFETLSLQVTESLLRLSSLNTNKTKSNMIDNLLAFNHFLKHKFNSWLLLYMLYNTKEIEYNVCIFSLFNAPYCTAVQQMEQHIKSTIQQMEQHIKSTIVDGVAHEVYYSGWSST